MMYFMFDQNDQMSAALKPIILMCSCPLSLKGLWVYEYLNESILKGYLKEYYTEMLTKKLNTKTIVLH